MIEFLRHFFGLCGENHPSFLTVLLGGSGALFGYKYAKFYYGSKIETWKETYNLTRRYIAGRTVR